MIVVLQGGRYKGATVHMPWHIAKPLLESGRVLKAGEELPPVAPAVNIPPAGAALSPPPKKKKRK